MKVIGLTGGIATGKSTVTKILREMGIPVIDADLIARQVVEPGKPAYREIIAGFGPEVLRADGTLDRKRLGRLVFQERRLLERLNQITHPYIIREIEHQLAELEAVGTALVVINAPLLIETGLHTTVDEVWVVTCNYRLQLQRLQARDNLAKQEAEARIRAQMPLAEKVKFAHRVIDNSKDIGHTRQQVKDFLRSSLQAR